MARSRFRFGGPRIRAAAFCALVCGAAPAAHADQAAFLPNESLVSARADLFDAEYHQARAEITWVSSGGKLWIAGIDRDTGLFKPSDGRGVLVDPDSEGSADLRLIGNGPEWLPAFGNDRIVYTKFVPGRPHRLENARIAMAQKDSRGVWHSELLSDQPRYRAYASADPGDPAPRISYLDPDGNAFWREVDNPNTETVVPQMAAARVLAMRFVEGQRAAIFVSEIAGVPQVVRYWLDTHWIEQLTFDGGHETTSSPFMWRAPEFGNDYVFAVTYNRATELRVYRQLDKSRPEWSVIYSAKVGDGSRLSSTEPFTFDGKSYVFMSAEVPPNDFPSAIFLSNIDASQPMLRQLTPKVPVRTRTDPEVFVTTTGPFIYFYRADRSTNPPCPCYEGTFRADTGLRAAAGR